MNLCALKEPASSGADAHLDQVYNQSIFLFITGSLVHACFLSSNGVAWAKEGKAIRSPNNFRPQPQGVILNAFAEAHNVSRGV